MLSRCMGAELGRGRGFAECTREGKGAKREQIHSEYGEEVVVGGLILSGTWTGLLAYYLLLIIYLLLLLLYYRQYLLLLCHLIYTYFFLLPVSFSFACYFSFFSSVADIFRLPFVAFVLWGFCVLYCLVLFNRLLYPVRVGGMAAV